MWSRHSCILMALVVAAVVAAAVVARWGEAALLKKPKNLLPFFFLSVASISRKVKKNLTLSEINSKLLFVISLINAT